MIRSRDAENADGVQKIGDTEDENIERKDNDNEFQKDGHQYVGSEENADDSNECECGHDGSDGEDSVGDEDLYLDDEDEPEAYHHSTFNVEQMLGCAAKVICFEWLPLTSEFCQEFLRSLCPSLTMDVESTTKACLRLFEEEKVKTRQALNSMDRSIAISVDVLSDYKKSGSINDFICLTAHFIDDDWNLRKWVLCFQEYMTSSNSDCIDAVILKSLKDWNIEDKVSNLTWRDADACDEAVDMIKTRVMEKRRLPLGSCLFSVSCVAEMFSLMAKDVFDHISELINKIQLLSWSKSNCMWHLTNSKLKNVLDLHLLGEFDSELEYDVPSADEWENLKVVHRLIDSAYNVAKLLFETKYPTANKFLYNLHELRTILVKESTSPDTFTRNVAKKMLLRLEKYLKDMFLLLAVASIMDPRCKMQYLEYMSSKFDDVQSGPVLEAIHGLYADYSSSNIEIDIEGASNSKPEKEDPTSDNEKIQTETETETWLDEYNQFVQTNNPPKKSDLNLYLEEPVLPWRDDFNTLLWWKSEAPKYPAVAKMAQNILAIPLSVATSYDAYYYLENRPPNWRVFESGPELMNALMCCRSWYNKKMAF